MKSIYKTIISSFLMLFSILGNISEVKSQTLDLSDLELKAHYELSSNGNETTGNYGNISLNDPVFEQGGILSLGCYVNDVDGGDSCLIETPQIDALNDLVYAIQVDFRISNFGGTIIMAGNSYRFLGIETNNSNKLVLRLDGNYLIDNTTLQPNTWYNITLKHNTLDSITHVFLDNQLIFSQKKHLFHPQNDTQISNTDFGLGQALDGHMKNLKVFSTNTITSLKSEFINPILSFYPNPAQSELTVELEYNQAKNLYYQIFDTQGKSMQLDKLNGNKISIENLPSGSYILHLEGDKKTSGSVQFVKE